MVILAYDAQALDQSPLELTQAAQGFAAVGSEPRLAVMLALVRAGPAGLSVGDIQARLGIPASTLAHHLRFLAAAGLLVQERHGREIRNYAAFTRIQALAAFLLHECCADRQGAGNGDDRQDDPQDGDTGQGTQT